MVTWSKVWKLASFSAFLMLAACGKDNGQVTANTPQQDCMSNGGANCQWSHFPQSWSQYPRGPNGYYAGYNPGDYPNQNQNQFNQCRNGTNPIYRQGWGMACAPIPPSGNLGYNQHCNAIYPQQPGNPGAENPCLPDQYCKTDFPAARQWNDQTYASWGVCWPKNSGYQY